MKEREILTLQRSANFLSNTDQAHCRVPTPIRPRRGRSSSGLEGCLPRQVRGGAWTCHQVVSYVLGKQHVELRVM